MKLCIFYLIIVKVAYRLELFFFIFYATSTTALDLYRCSTVFCQNECYQYLNRGKHNFSEHKNFFPPFDFFITVGSTPISHRSETWNFILAFASWVFPPAFISVEFNFFILLRARVWITSSRKFKINFW